MEQRKSQRRRGLRTQPQLTVMVGSETLSAKLIDYSEGGFGLEIRQALDVGCHVRVQGQLSQGVTVRSVDVTGEVKWCRPSEGGAYAFGFAFETEGPRNAPIKAEESDYYEVLQLSPNANFETIHRVFRLLAQHFHPDNRDTGDEGRFKVLLQAHQTLSNPEKRAAYDVRRIEQQKLRYKLFESAQAAKGVEAERRKRHGVLWLLYMRRLNQPHEPTMSLQELEDFLGCPKEHLEFTMWFLKENAWIIRFDNGRTAITAKGVERAELSSLPPVELPTDESRMLAAPL